jgi:hypothetical protein
VCFSWEAIERAANISAIFTAFVAGAFWGSQKWARCRKKSKLESYLKEKAETRQQGKLARCTVTHLMAHLKLTEEEILNASFSSKRIKCDVTKDGDTGLADKLMLSYDNSN